VHSFVSTSQLLIAYTASLSQYTKNNAQYPEIDFENWSRKINAEITKTQNILNHQPLESESLKTKSIKTHDLVDDLLQKRKSEIDDNILYDLRDQQTTTRLTTLKSIQELLELIYDVAREQRKVVEHYYRINPQS